MGTYLQWFQFKIRLLLPPDTPPGGVTGRYADSPIKVRKGSWCIRTSPLSVLLPVLFHQPPE